MLVTDIFEYMLTRVGVQTSSRVLGVYLGLDDAVSGVSSVCDASIDQGIINN